MDYVEAAKLRGEGMGWIVFKEIVPNILPPLITEFGLRFCFVFLTIAALSFLGVGIQPPTADWGSMVAENKTLITLWQSDAALSRRRHCAADGGGQFRRRLVPAQDKRACAMATENKRVKGEVLLEIKGLQDRRQERRRLAPDRQGRRSHAEARRSAGPDRRIGCRQIHAGPCRHGLCPARLPHQRRHHQCSTASI